MPADRLVLLPCDIYLGGFPSERVFEIRLPEGEYTGAAPREYFWTEQQQRLPADQPKERGTLMPGYVDARVAAELGKQRLLLSIPSGDVLEVNEDMVKEHPSERVTHVSVQP